jgi:RND family efflux transporter MFP subunit
VIQPERRTIRKSTEQPGQIEAYETTPIHAKISGFVEKWNVDIGAKVTKGQVLAVLSDPELDAEAEQKQAEVEEAIAKLDQAKASEEVARANLVSADAKLAEAQAGIKRADSDLVRWQAEYKRVEQLFHERAQTGSLLDETRSKLKSSESARDEVHAQVRSADAAIKQSKALLDKALSDVIAAKASIKIARADLRRVEALRGYTRIIAPYDGVVARRNIDVGELTEPGPQGQPLFVVVRDDLVRITVNVPEMYATDVEPGDRALIRLQALGVKDFEGKVTRTSWTLDAKNRTLRAEIDVPNAKGTLRPGLYAYATVIVEERPEVMTLPLTAVGRDGERAYCVAVRDGIATRLPIRLGLSDGTHVEVISGVSANDSVAKTGVASLTTGQSVDTIEPPKPASSGAKP